MKKHEVAKLFEKIVLFYPSFGGDRSAAMEKINVWHETLDQVTFDHAYENLKRYVADPDNKFAPHPGALARSLDAKTESDRYHESMKQSGSQTIQSLDEMRTKAVGPTEEQRRKVREYFGRTV